MLLNAGGNPTISLMINHFSSNRDPDITFFDQMSQQIVMYRYIFLCSNTSCAYFYFNMFGLSYAFSSRVKPAAFDLFLGGCIAAYLAIVYYTIQVRKCTLFTLSIHTVLHSTLHFFLCFEHFRFVLSQHLSVLSYRILIIST